MIFYGCLRVPRTDRGPYLFNARVYWADLIHARRLLFLDTRFGVTDRLGECFYEALMQ